MPLSGATTGYNFGYSIGIQAGVEIVAASILISYWDDSTSPAVYISVMLFVILIINLIDVRVFGEVLNPVALDSIS